MGFNPRRQPGKTILRQRLIRKMKPQMPFGHREACIARKIAKQRWTAVRGNRIAQVTVVLVTRYLIAHYRR